MILMIILIKGALDRRVLESHQDLPLLHDQDRWICWGWGKYENIREKFFSSNWGERKANNIIEDGIFFAQIFFSSDLGLPTQPETPNPYNQGTWEMTLTKSLWLRESDLFLLHCLKGRCYEYEDFLLGCRPSSQLHESWRDRNSDMRWRCRRVVVRKLFWKSQSLFWSWLSSFPQVGVSNPVGQQLGQLQQTRPDERKWYVRQAMSPSIWSFTIFSLVS